MRAAFQLIRQTRGGDQVERQRPAGHPPEPRRDSQRRLKLGRRRRIRHHDRRRIGQERALENWERQAREVGRRRDDLVREQQRRAGADYYAGIVFGAARLVGIQQHAQQMTAIAAGEQQRRRGDRNGDAALAGLVEQHGAQGHVIEQHLQHAAEHAPAAAVWSGCAGDRPVVAGEERIEIELESRAGAEFPVGRQAKIDRRRVERPAQALFGGAQTRKADQRFIIRQATSVALLRRRPQADQRSAEDEIAEPPSQRCRDRHHTCSIDETPASPTRHHRSSPIAAAA